MTTPVIFAGTPQFAVPTLQTLIDDPSYDVVAVYTQPDRPKGRGQKLTSSPIKQLAEKYQLPVEQPLSFQKADSIINLKNYSAAMMVVAAYGLLLPEQVLNLFPLGCINIHASLLPRWRGAAPIQRAILAGDAKTGISIMQMEKGLDTGPIFCTETCDIYPNDTAADLHDRLSFLGAKTLLKCLPQIIHQQIKPQLQDHSAATYAHKITKSEAKINWQEPAEIIHRMIRAFNPWPVAYTHWQNQIVRIWKSEIIHTQTTHVPGTIIHADKDGLDIATGSEILRILVLQFPNSNALPIQAILNAKRKIFTVANKFT